MASKKLFFLSSTANRSIAQIAINAESMKGKSEEWGGQKIFLFREKCDKTHSNGIEINIRAKSAMTLLCEMGCAEHEREKEKTLLISNQVGFRFFRHTFVNVPGWEREAKKKHGEKRWQMPANFAMRTIHTQRYGKIIWIFDLSTLGATLLFHRHSHQRCFCSHFLLALAASFRLQHYCRCVRSCHIIKIHSSQAIAACVRR